MMADKENMKETAARQIVEAVQFANFAGVNAADFGVSLSASLFRNIRDAMFHFNAMCDYFDTDLKHDVIFNELLSYFTSRNRQNFSVIEFRNLSEPLFGYKYFRKILLQPESATDAYVVSNPNHAAGFGHIFLHEKDQNNSCTQFPNCL